MSVSFKSLSAAFIATLMLVAPALADLTHEEVRVGAKVVLSKDAKMRFKCKSGFECEDQLKQYSLGTISDIKGFQAYIKLKDGGKIIVGNYNESGMMGADLETSELLQERAAWLEKEKAAEKARKETIKRMAESLKSLKATTSWTFEGVALGTELPEVKKALRAKKYGVADLGDDIWAVNGYQVDSQAVQVHLWFNSVGMLYKVEVFGEGLDAQKFQKTAVGQMNGFKEKLSGIFGTPSEDKKYDIYLIGDEEIHPFVRWQMVDVEAMVGCVMNDNKYMPAMTVTALKLSEVPDAGD